jgi:hypothetical protein
MLAHQVLLSARQFGHFSSNAAGSGKSTKFGHDSCRGESRNGKRKKATNHRCLDVFCLKDDRTLVQSTPTQNRLPKSESSSIRGELGPFWGSVTTAGATRRQEKLHVLETARLSGQTGKRPLKCVPHREAAMTRIADVFQVHKTGRLTVIGVNPEGVF